jgi:hypothetical protein
MTKENKEILSQEEFLLEAKKLGIDLGDSYVPKGWYFLVLNLFKAIRKNQPDIVFSDCYLKEKFGTLRSHFNYEYQDFTDEEIKNIEELNSQAEWESSFTCEECGATNANSCGSSWIRTMCPEHEYIAGGKL